jgi:hypothetical protein
VVIDEIHPGLVGLGGEHRRGERALQLQGSQPSAMAASRGRSVRSSGSAVIPASGPML